MNFVIDINLSSVKKASLQHAKGRGLRKSADELRIQPSDVKYLFLRFSYYIYRVRTAPYKSHTVPTTKKDLT